MKTSILFSLVIVVIGLICFAELGGAAKRKTAAAKRKGITVRRPRRNRNNWWPWGEFGPCSATCGIGTMIRYRECKTFRCRGDYFSTKTCFVRACGEGKWSKWSEFSACSVSCGGGTKLRRRICRGFGCSGPDEHTKPCNKIRCKGKWSAWGPPSACNKKCGGGIRRRTRTCLTEITCYGPTIKREKCATRECPEPSIWGPWTEFAPCTKSCGTGIKVRTRVCKSKICKGPSTQTGKCRTDPCPAPSIWGEWGKFTQCSKSCGAGIKIRKRECKSKTCTKGPDRQIGTCRDVPCPGKWSECTKSCGTGTRFTFDSKTCTNPANAKCFKTFEECNTMPCPQETCLPGKDYRYGMNHSCCDTGEGGGRVIRGREAQLGQWPWMILIIINRGMCGGSLIHPRWVLTAGHCFSAGRDPDLSSINVYAGLQNLSEVLDNTARRYTVDRLIRHPQQKELSNDLALLKLSEEINTFAIATISTVSLPLGEETPQDSTCFVTGWGKTDPQSFEASDPLMQVDVQILDVSVCRKAYKDNDEVKKYVLESNKLLCAGSLTKENDACAGDSGGPLVCQRCSSCDWYLAGVTSFGPADNCGLPGHPGMYSKVKVFENWIFSHIPSLKGKRQECEYRYGP